VCCATDAVPALAIVHVQPVINGDLFACAYVAPGVDVDATAYRVGVARVVEIAARRQQNGARLEIQFARVSLILLRQRRMSLFLTTLPCRRRKVNSPRAKSPLPFTPVSPTTTSRRTSLKPSLMRYSSSTGRPTISISFSALVEVAMPGRSV
jgi:hypothetical protein